MHFTRLDHNTFGAHLQSFTDKIFKSNLDSHKTYILSKYLLSYNTKVLRMLFNIYKRERFINQLALFCTSFVSALRTEISPLTSPTHPHRWRAQCHIQSFFNCSELHDFVQTNSVASTSRCCRCSCCCCCFCCCR